MILYIHLNTVYLCTALYFNVRMNKDIIYIWILRSLVWIIGG